MEELHTKLAGLETWMIGRPQSSSCTVVFLHGKGMRAGDLTPFSHSLAIPGVAFVFPQAPHALGGGYAWWHGDETQQRERGPVDLQDLLPLGRSDARRRLGELLSEVRAAGGAGKLLLAGFSQGGMLACDSVLMDATPVDGLALLSSSRIAIAEWSLKRGQVNGTPAFVSHGRADPDLAFAAGLALKNFLQQGGAAVTWVPFDGGHEIPFPVWREFRRFTRDLAGPAPSTNGKHAPHGPH